jgi:hypothetical protein
MQKRVIFLILALFLIPAVAFASNDACVGCHTSAAEGKMKFEGGKFQDSVHGFLTCTDCHEKFAGPNAHFMPEGEVTPMVQVISEKIAPKGGADPVAKSACIKCHTDIFNEVLDSAHGENIAKKGAADGPLCADCHGSPHYLSKESSPVARSSVVNTCGKCHSDEGLSRKYGIESDVMESYLESFHGRKLIIGHTKAPTCVDCHSSHGIKHSEDPESTVFGQNKITTCDKCHPGANETFVPAITHKKVGPIPHYAEIGLILLVLGTIGFVLLHFLLEAFSDIRDSLFRKSEHEHEMPDDTEEVERFNIHFRVQHVLLFSSFLVLAFTGWGSSTHSSTSLTG